jgi:hypothetical protein
LFAVYTERHKADFIEGNTMRFRIDDTDYDWEPGIHTVEVLRIREWEGQYGPAMLWTFCEPGRPKHRVTGMTSMSYSPRAKLVNWFLAATGYQLDAVRTNELDTTDALESLVVADIGYHSTPYGPRSRVIDVVRATPEAIAAVKPVE